MDHDMSRCGDLQLDIDARVAYVGEQRVILTFEEFELLRKLVEDPGRAFTREELHGDRSPASSDRTVDVRVMRLRKKLGGAREFTIETVPQVGYRCWPAVPAQRDGASAEGSFRAIR
jgi:DNA-binding response OmpR family regulator